MSKEIKVINTEDNKSEIDNVIMPTGNCHFLNSYKLKNNLIYLKNIKSKLSFNDNINNKLFSNLLLKDLFIEEKKNNLLNPSFLKKIKDYAILKQNKAYKIPNNIINNICSIKRNTIKFYENKKTKTKDKAPKKNKKKDKKICGSNCLQKKKIYRNRIPNIKDMSCENNSFSIHLEKRKDNSSILSNLSNLQINNSLYSPQESITIIQEKNNLLNKRSLLHKKKSKNNSLNYNYDYNLNEIDMFHKMKHSSSSYYFSNLLSPGNSIINNNRYINKDFMTSRSSNSNINYLPNSSNNKKLYMYNKLTPCNKSLLNNHNNISNFFHVKKDCQGKNKKIDINSNLRMYKNNNFSKIENHKNENNNKPFNLKAKANNNQKGVIRVKSSYMRTNKYNLEYTNSFSHKKLLNTKFINLKKYKIKDNIISNILADIQENKSINNNLVSELYKRPLINIYTLLELKNSDINK